MKPRKSLKEQLSDTLKPAEIVPTAADFDDVLKGFSAILARGADSLGAEQEAKKCVRRPGEGEYRAFRILIASILLKCPLIAKEATGLCRDYGYSKSDIGDAIRAAMSSPQRNAVGMDSAYESAISRKKDILIAAIRLKVTDGGGSNFKIIEDSGDEIRFSYKSVGIEEDGSTVDVTTSVTLDFDNDLAKIDYMNEQTLVIHEIDYSPMDKWYKSGDIVMDVPKWIEEDDSDGEDLSECWSWLNEDLTPLEKMQLFDAGQRRENVKACKDQKLLDYYDICLRNNLRTAAGQIEAELNRRGLLNPQPAQSQDDQIEFEYFNYAFYDALHGAYIKSILTKPADALLADISKFEYRPNRISFFFSMLLVSVVLGLTDKAQAALAALLQEGISKNTIRDTLAKCRQDQTLIDKLKKATSLIDDEELREDIEKHETLNAKLFDPHGKMRPEVRRKALELADYFIGTLAEDGIPINVKDIIMTGSNASYNYTADSDIDLHIIAEAESLGCPHDLYPKLYNAYKSLFNNKRDVTYYGIPVEVYVETLGTPSVSNGVYSVLNDDWVKMPTKDSIPEIDQAKFDKAFAPWEKECDELIAKLKSEDDPDETEIDGFIDKLYALRIAGLADGGEYSTDNLIFKEMRNRGKIDELKQLKSDIVDAKLSLK